MLVGVAGLLLLLAIFALAGWLLWQSLRAERLSDVQRAAQTMEEHAEKIIGGHLAALGQVEWVVRDIGMSAARGSPTLHERLLAVEEARPEVQSVWLFDPRGDVLATSIGFPPPKTNFADRDYFQAAASGQDAFIGAVLRGRLTEELNFNLAKRLEDAEGNFLGVIVVSLYPQAFEEFYAGLSRPGDLALLLRANGDVLASYPPPDLDPVGLRVASALVPAIQPSEPGMLAIDPDAYRFATRQVGAMPIYVAYGASKEKIFQEWLDLLGLSALFAGPAFLALAGLLVVAHGQAGRIDSAQEELKRLNRGLEARVAERTAALNESDARQRIATYAAGLGVFDWSIRKDEAVWENDRMYEIFGRDRSDGPLTRAEFRDKCLHPDDRDIAEAAFTTRPAGGEPFRLACRMHRLSDGMLRWIEVTGRLSFENGTPDRLVGVVADVTERKQEEGRRNLLVGELDHRVKNTLSVVQALARQTFSDGTELAAARVAFEGRLSALAAANGQLAHGDWQSGTLPEIAAEAVRACGVPDDRVAISGPRVVLRAKAALAIAMALHELCTNAIKYGALSNDTGRIALGWTVSPARHLALTWQETGGPPVTPPSRQGFGSIVIRQIAERELGGRSTLDYRPEGLVCTLTADL